MWGLEPSHVAPELYAALKRHTIALLNDPQKRNLFPDGGIRLSSTSSNSWMSKIAIFMHVARRIFQLDRDPEIAALLKKADHAHVKWQTDGSGYWACSDQFIDGIAKGRGDGSSRQGLASANVLPVRRRCRIGRRR